MNNLLDEFGEDFEFCGYCPVCGDPVDHSDAGFCDDCGQPFHWTDCGTWVDSKHCCTNCQRIEGDS